MKTTSWQIPEDLRIAPFRFILKPGELMELPAYKGPVLRGGLGMVLKRLVCVQRDTEACTPCQVGNACPYGYLFETQAPLGNPVMPTVSDVPIPFVLEPPLDHRMLYQAGEHIVFNLVLIGRGVQYLPYFLMGFQELGQSGLGRRRARYDLSTVELLNPLTGAAQTIFADGVARMPSTDPGVTAAELAEYAARLPTDQLTLRFVTPMRIKHQGDYIDRPDFHVLIRSLLRRISTLTYFHCDRQWEVDFRAIIAAAGQVETVAVVTDRVGWGRRYSTRQRQHVWLDGFVGEAIYRGDLEQFRSLLVLGSLVHVGKATVFGHGNYQVVNGSVEAGQSV